MDETYVNIYIAIYFLGFLFVFQYLDGLTQFIRENIGEDISLEETYYFSSVFLLALIFWPLAVILWVYYYIKIFVMTFKQQIKMEKKLYDEQK
jgi:hypothetical protein